MYELNIVCQTRHHKQPTFPKSFQGINLIFIFISTFREQSIKKLNTSRHNCPTEALLWSIVIDLEAKLKESKKSVAILFHTKQIIVGNFIWNAVHNWFTNMKKFGNFFLLNLLLSAIRRTGNKTYYNIPEGNLEQWSFIFENKPKLMAQLFQPERSNETEYARHAYRTYLTSLGTLYKTNRIASVCLHVPYSNYVNTKQPIN